MGSEPRSVLALPARRTPLDIPLSVTRRFRGVEVWFQDEARIGQKNGLMR